MGEMAKAMMEDAMHPTVPLQDEDFLLGEDLAHALEEYQSERFYGHPNQMSPVNQEVEDDDLDYEEEDDDENDLLDDNED